MNQTKEQTDTSEYGNLFKATSVMESSDTAETLPYCDCEKYDLCEFYYFRRPHLKIGFQPAQGGSVQEAATIYPDAWQYLQTLEGRKLCVTESEWQAMTQAVWHTNADGTTVGWNGIGGAPFYAPDYSTGALRLPDIRGMYMEAAGFDALDVGGVHIDMIRNITGSTTTWGNSSGGIVSAKGAVTRGSAVKSAMQHGSTAYNIAIDASLTVPVGNKNAPRAFGVLPCVYLGMPR